MLAKWLPNEVIVNKGVNCDTLAGENFVATYWLLSNADRGVKLQVKESQAQRALEILQTKGNHGLEETEDKDVAQEPYDLQCPKCHSENIEYERFSRKVFFFSILFVRFPLPFLKKSYRCSECGHVWK